ncbi:MAG TPA: response regulator, partial [Pseudobdellovibrionaceae bacterium]
MIQFPAGPNHLIFTEHKKTTSQDDQLQLSGVKILLVDDSRESLVIISHLLRRVGALVDFALDGEKALECNASTVYDIILMDISMPVMDGIEATR